MCKVSLILTRLLEKRLMYGFQQCNQKPAHRNHQFCGKRCADSWAAGQGQANMMGYLGTLLSLPWNQNQHVAQGNAQPGQGRGGSESLITYRT